MNTSVLLPNTADEAVYMLQRHEGKILAGGTDLLIELRKENKKCEYFIDINNIMELKRIEISGDTLRLGCAVTFADIINNSYIRDNIPALWEAAFRMGACQIQKRATIGGNICNAAPAADSIPILMVLGAICILRGTAGQRKLLIKEFIIGNGKTRLEAGEILEAIEFDNLKAGEVCGFAKLGKRNSLSISTITCAVKLVILENMIAECYLCTGSLGSKACRESNTEGYLKGKPVLKIGEYIEEAAAVLSQEVEQRLSTRPSIIYKKVAVKGVFKEAFNKAIGHFI